LDIQNYFYENAMGKIFEFIFKADGNAIALLCFYIMQPTNLGHPKLILELLTEATCVDQLDVN
jgi:hypothetical protein